MIWEGGTNKKVEMNEWEGEMNEWEGEMNDICGTKGGE